MARKKSETLTDAELRLMEILWEKGSATVSDVLDALPEDNKSAYSTVLTFMRILERKGYVTHEKRSRAFVYSPVIGRSEARQNVIGYVLNRFFNNSPEQLVLNMLENGKLNPKELEKLKKLLAKKK